MPFKRAALAVLVMAAGATARADKIVPTPTGACANPSGGYEGFGRNTTGGAGKPVYRVTNLNDNGTGSLRDALSRGNRCVVFDVGGTISAAALLTKSVASPIAIPGFKLKNKVMLEN